jgi:hypothetical protein
VEADERQMEQWRRLYLGDVDTEVAFLLAKEGRDEDEKEGEDEEEGFHRGQLNGSSMIDENDDGWSDLFLTSEEDTKEATTTIPTSSL